MDSERRHQKVLILREQRLDLDFIVLKVTLVPLAFVFVCLKIEKFSKPDSIFR
jgi:hypothetical protein